MMAAVKRGRIPSLFASPSEIADRCKKGLMNPHPAVPEERVCLSDLIGLPSNHRDVERLVSRGIVERNPYDPNSLVLLDREENAMHDHRRCEVEDWTATRTHREPQGWNRHLETHRRHPSFRIHTWAMSREYGFSCECAGHEEEWRITITQIRQMMMDAPRFLAGFETMVRQRAGDKAKKRDLRRAHAKAKALLYHNLTREQKWELRATQSFTIVGADGKQYRITEAVSSNVKYVVDGVDQQSLCVVAAGIQLPVYDLMLAQKLMLECAPEAFWQLAVVTNLVSETSPARVRRDLDRMARATQMLRTG